MNVRLWMYQVLLFKFRRHLCKGSIGCIKPNNNLSPLLRMPKIKKNLDFTFATKRRYCSF